jgi:hypothetical protein
MKFLFHECREQDTWTATAVNMTIVRDSWLELENLYAWTPSTHASKMYSLWFCMSYETSCSCTDYTNLFQRWNTQLHIPVQKLTLNYIIKSYCHKQTIQNTSTESCNGTATEVNFFYTLTLLKYTASRKNKHVNTQWKEINELPGAHNPLIHTGLWQT